jgi:hypothetical protein
MGESFHQSLSPSTRPQASQASSPQPAKPSPTANTPNSRAPSSRQCWRSSCKLRAIVTFFHSSSVSRLYNPTTAILVPSAFLRLSRGHCPPPIRVRFSPTNCQPRPGALASPYSVLRTPTPYSTAHLFSFSTKHLSQPFRSPFQLSSAPVPTATYSLTSSTSLTLSRPHQ